MKQINEDDFFGSIRLTKNNRKKMTTLEQLEIDEINDLEEILESLGSKVDKSFKWNKLWSNEEIKGILEWGTIHHIRNNKFTKDVRYEEI